MQGFEQMLKMMGIDPQKMLADAQAVINQFEERMKARDEAMLSAINAGFDKVGGKLESMDAVLKALDPNYVPEEFKSGDMIIVGEVIQPALTNPDTPEGGPVDPASLDPEKLAAMEDGPTVQDVRDAMQGIKPAMTNAQKAKAAKAAKTGGQ